MLTLTAPTGQGKTLSSINFALNIRKRVEWEKGYTPRIIYVAPFISILDQNWKVLQEVFQGHKLEVEGKVKQEQQTNLLLMHHHLSPISYSKAKNANEEQLKESYSTSLHFYPVL
ncbi:MAG: DEAD/DEAH box helicase [Nitrososphaeraceae archaeon]|nr:DEAD/DEAH box helicase [Nitrososphaeraceae archaeon]